MPPGGGALEIVLSPNGGQVDGVVLDDKQQPAAGAKVALAPDEARRGRTDLYKTAVTDQYGRFTMRGIAPGDYKLFAWAELEPGAAQDPEFLKPYEKAGEAVSVQRERARGGAVETAAGGGAMTFGWTGVDVPAVGQGTWMIDGSGVRRAAAGAGPRA